MERGDDMTNLQNLFKRINTLRSEISNILKLAGIDGMDILVDKTNLDDKFIFGQLQDILVLFDDVNFKLNYLSKEISTQGFVSLNSRGQYEFANGEYLTTGSAIELLISDEEGQQEWISTHVTYFNGKYQAMTHEIEYPIKETLIRIRR